MKIRIYNLAKELKTTNERIIEEARHSGVEARVPSHTIPPEIAQKIREKFAKGISKEK